MIVKDGLAQTPGDGSPRGLVAATMRRAEEDDAGGSVKQGGCSLVPALVTELKSLAKCLPLEVSALAYSREVQVEH